MEAVILMGIQGSGKSSFFKSEFADTHVRINGDMLKSKYKENLLIDACIKGNHPFVIDKMNFTPKHRAPYIEKARSAGWKVKGYFMHSDLTTCIARNLKRPNETRIPMKAVIRTHADIINPTPGEGFDELYYVNTGGGKFDIKELD